MVSLILNHNGPEARIYDLSKPSLSIGRRSDNDITVKHREVSGHHAKIICALDKYFIEDLNSTNGTFLNKKRVKRAALCDGDEIVVGDHVMLFRNKNKAKNADSITESEESESHAASTPNLVKLERPKRQAPSDSNSAKIHIRSGVRAGQQVDLTKSVTTLGRPGAQIAVISRENINDYYLIHVNSGDNSKPCKLNGKFVGQSREPLSHGDWLEVAGVELQFEVAH